MTLTRATLAVGVAALAADSFDRARPVATLVALASVALVLDFVDGRVARRTGTTSALGARFDGEIDAFLILALSVYVAQSVGAWVLAIGAARYAFLAAGWVLAVDARDAAAARLAQGRRGDAGNRPDGRRGGRSAAALTRAALAVALALLAESFGRDVWWLWRHRQASAGAGVAGRRARTRPRRLLAPCSRCSRSCSCGPRSSLPTSPAGSRPARSCGSRSRASSSSRWPLVLPAPRGVSWPGWSGRRSGCWSLVKVVDIGFFTAFDRPFNPVDDWGYTRIGIETLRDSIGRTRRTWPWPAWRWSGVAASSSRPWRCFA